jgi:sugar fermentation stimulation protein A
LEPVIYPRPQALLSGVLVQRYKRFFADVDLDDGRRVVAHCVNTGAMEGLTKPGTRVWVRPVDNPDRKLKFTWELAEIAGQITGVDTSLPNRIVRTLLEERRLPFLSDWIEMKPEKKYGERSRVDFWLRTESHEAFLEVKNCHLIYPDLRGYFPDCVSERASGHLAELSGLMSRPGQSGLPCRSEVLFFAQMPDVKAIRPSDLHDPAFALAARAAAAAGVQFRALRIRHTPEAIRVDGIIPVELETYDLDPIREYYRVSAGKEPKAGKKGAGARG